VNEVGFPTQDAAARDYMLNVANIINNNLASYMLAQADADALLQAATNYSNAYTLATNTPTRTKLTIIQKDELRDLAEALFRNPSPRGRPATPAWNQNSYQ
jgi:hypothetical protein